jgi:hypothetical protein
MCRSPPLIHICTNSSLTYKVVYLLFPLETDSLYLPSPHSTALIQKNFRYACKWYLPLVWCFSIPTQKLSIPSNHSTKSLRTSLYGTTGLIVILKLLPERPLVPTCSNRSHIYNDFNLQIILSIKYVLHYNSISLNARENGQCLGYNYATHFLVHISTPYKLVESQPWDRKIWSWLLRDSGLRISALAKPSSNCKLQSGHLVREGAPYQHTRNCLTVNKNLVMGPR